MDSKGLFISFEGGEGSGKTTQINLLAKRLEEEGHQVLMTREPGGTPEAEKIRDLLVQREGGNWTPTAEALLFFAARHMHVEQLIKPALNEGYIVLCDRFTDSTRAYQSHGHGMDHEIIERMNRLVLGNFQPDLTIILDLPVEEGIKRSTLKNQAAGEHSREFTEDRYEQMDKAFHERLRQGYLAIARKEGERCKVVNANTTMEEVAEQIYQETMRHV